jgi:pimeloyl-ACP methyl ester carboxylesterase
MERHGPDEVVSLPGADGIVLVGDRYGDPVDPPVLLLHGGGQTRAAWGATARAVAAAGWCVTALDLRGHGESGWSEDGDYDIERFGDDVLSVRRQLSRPPVVVGASLGGISALVAQQRSAEQLYAAVVLVDVAPRMELVGIRRILGFMTAHPEGFASLEEAADVIAAYREHRARPSDVSGLTKVLRRSADGRWRWHWDPRFMGLASTVLSGDDDEPGHLVLAAKEVLLAAAQSVRVPMLLVRGAESDMVSDEGVEELRGAVPHARFVDVSGAGHMVAGDRNDAFTEAVLSFLVTLER